MLSLILLAWKILNAKLSKPWNDFTVNIFEALTCFPTKIWTYLKKSIIEIFILYQYLKMQIIIKRNLFEKIAKAKIRKIIEEANQCMSTDFFKLYRIEWKFPVVVNQFYYFSFYAESGIRLKSEQNFV